MTALPPFDFSTLTLDEFKHYYDKPFIIKRLQDEWTSTLTSAFRAVLNAGCKEDPAPSAPVPTAQEQAEFDQLQTDTISLQLIQYGISLASFKTLKACQDIVDMFKSLGFTKIAQELVDRGLEDYTMDDTWEACGDYWDQPCSLDQVVYHVNHRFKDRETVRIIGFMDRYENFQYEKAYTKDHPDEKRYNDPSYPWNADDDWVNTCLTDVQAGQEPTDEQMDKMEQLGFLYIAKQLRALKSGTKNRNQLF